MSDRVAPAAYVDSNVFIEAIEGPDEVALPIKQLFQYARERRSRLVSSELTLAEVLAPPRGAKARDELASLYVGLLLEQGLFELKPVSRDVLLSTVGLRRTVRLKLPDAIHLATAIQQGCLYFVSRDRDFRSLPHEIETIEPEADPLARLMGALS
jgi:predicted nucleic acid-binding protein